MNSIIWKGVSSTTIQGLLISELPPITKPEMRIRETEIDGRDGSIIEELGYSSYVKTVKIGLHGDFDINKVIKYFTGEGDIVFSNEPDKVYKAKICGKIDYTRLLRYRQASIPFMVQPFKYKLNEYLRETQTAMASGTIIALNDSANANLKAFGIDGYNDLTKIIVSGKNLLAEPFSIGVYKQNGYDPNPSVICTKSVYLPAGTYVASAFGVADCSMFVNGMIDDTHTSDYQLSYWMGRKVTILEGGLYNVQFNKTDGTTFTDAELQVVNASAQLEFGTTATEYEPYKGQSITVSTALTEEEIALFKTLKSYEPTTIVFNDANSSMNVEYFKPFEVFNEGLEDSKPLMILKGSGTVEISVNGVGIFSYTFPEGENEVYIDSEKEDAYLGTELKNRNMNGEFPILIPKTNIIEWSGDIESISILPRSRWL